MVFGQPFFISIKGNEFAAAFAASAQHLDGQRYGVELIVGLPTRKRANLI